jgi:phage terminase large subunit
MKLEIEIPEWAEPLLQPARYKGAFGGRGSGKSHFFAGQVVDEALEGKNIVCVREIQKSLAQSAKKLIEGKIKQFNVGKYFEVQQTQIKGPSGNLIIFNGLQDHNAESIKSLEGYDIAWVEEAQSISQRSLELLRPTIRKEGSEIWSSWNPRNETDPIDTLLRGENIPPGSCVVNCNYDNNPWFPDVLKSELEYDKRRDPEKYQHVWLGGYLRNSEARVFKNWKVEEFETPTDAVFRLGADWGFSIDPTVLIRNFIEARRLYIDHEAYEIGCEIENIPLLFQTIPDSELWPIVADNQRPDTIDYVRRHGFPKIYAAAKGKGSIEDGIEWLKNYDIIVHPRCKHTIDELTLCSYKVDKNTGKVLPILEDKNNHVIDALRYANEGHRRAKQTSSKPVHYEAEVYF